MAMVASSCACDRQVLIKPNPPLECLPQVNDIVSRVIEANGTLYVSGNFTRIGGKPRHGYAAVDAASGEVLDSFIADIDLDAKAGGMILAQGRLIGVGNYSHVNGVPRGGLVALDPLTGKVLDWGSPPLFSKDGKTVAGALELATDGTYAYVVGHFEYVGLKPRHHIAAFRLKDGSLVDPWAENPSMDGWVFTALCAEEKLFVGGSFCNLGKGEQHLRLAALDPASGKAIPGWDVRLDTQAPDTGAYWMNSWGLAYHKGVLYVSGRFDDVNGQPRSNLAAVSASTGALLAWSPAAELNNDRLAVWGIASHGSSIYVIGDIKSLNGVSRSFGGAVDLSGAVLPFDPQLDNKASWATLIGDRLYIGGNQASPQAGWTAYQADDLVPACPGAW
jgi:hypothetical protein